mgnify:CR=1 FL=1
MIDLRNCDCMDYLATCKDNAFELAIVDPPYTNDTQGLKAGYNRSHFNYEVLLKPPTETYIKELFRVSQNQIIFGFNYFLDLLPATKSVLCWWKHQTGHFSECEYAWCSLGKSRLYDRAYQKDLFNKIHPTQKPVKLYEWLLINYAKKGDLILDTHLGSGSIALASHNLGFDLVGCELDEDYYNAACKRLKQHQAQQRMF